MKLRGALLALSMLAFAAPAHAENPAIAPTPALAEIEPALYVVRDADSTIYLFGTVHIRRPGSHWGGANARAALQEAEEVWTELNMADQSEAESAALILAYGMSINGEPLSSHLTPAQNRQMREITKQLGLPAEMFERMRPWLAAITLSMTPMMQAGYEAEAGADSMIEAQAIANGQRRRAFETMREQISFLANLPIEVQRQMLVDSLEPTDMSAADSDIMQTAWEQGDMETLERYVIDDMREQYPAVYDVLIVRRNNAWMDVLMTELEGSGVDFIAVGAGHLLGEHGLVDQFRARGIVVERVAP